MNFTILFFFVVVLVLLVPVAAGLCLNDLEMSANTDQFTRHLLHLLHSRHVVALASGTVNTRLMSTLLLVSNRNQCVTSSLERSSNSPTTPSPGANDESTHTHIHTLLLRHSVSLGILNRITDLVINSYFMVNIILT